MTAFEAGEVALVRFPFTDLTSSKQRPALVVSPAAYAARHGDVVVLALTSRPQPDDATVLDRWREAGLPKPTWIKPLIATLATTMFTRTLGYIEPEDWSSVDRTIRLLLADLFVGRA